MLRFSTVSALALAALALAACEREVILEGERFGTRVPLEASLPTETDPSPAAPADQANAVVPIALPAMQANADWTVESGSPATSSAPYRVYNIGNSSPVELMDYITALEEAMGMEAEKNMMPIQPGDVLETSADTKPLYDLVGFKPQTSVKDGVKNFVDWYKAYYQA